MPVIKQLLLPDVVDMMAHFIWVPELYRTYCYSIKEEHFKQLPGNIDEDETCLAYIWGALKNYYDSQGTKEVPDKSRFEVYIRTYLRGVSCDESLVEERIFGEDPEMSFLANLFDDERKTLNYASGEALAQQFLLERIIVNSLIKRVNEMREFSGCVDPNEAANLRKMADEASRVEAISAEMEIQPLAPDLKEFSKIPTQRVIASGVPWIDSRINGGQRYGEVNGLLGPTGSGKTTLGCQLFVSNVKEAFKDYVNKIDDRVCVYFTYEQSAFEVQRTRILSCAFKIARSSFADDVNPEESFTQAERDLYYAERDLFNRHGIIRNMSGVPDPWDDEKVAQMKRHKGEGGIDEIVHELDYITSKRKQKIRAVFIDYLGLVIDRQYLGRDEKERWTAMRSFGDAVRQKVAGAYDCTVWLLHQMSGVANSKNPTVPLKHTDASGCKSIADNMANCLCLGNPDSGSAHGGKCLYLTFSKVRNMGSSGFEDQNLILQHDTQFAQLNDVSGKYQPDKGSQNFYYVDDGYF